MAPNPPPPPLDSLLTILSACVHYTILLQPLPTRRIGKEKIAKNSEERRQEHILMTKLLTLTQKKKFFLLRTVSVFVL